MIVESGNQQPNVNVFPNGNGYGSNGGDMFGNNGAWWIIILFLFAMMGNWGNNGNNNGGNVTYVPFNGFGGGQNYVQQGFDQAAVMSGINGIQTSVANGFANAEVSRCNGQANILAALNNNQNATTSNMNALAMSLQNCCCENRAATADLKYAIATENCADRNALSEALQTVTAQNNANTQRILDMMCQDKIDAKNERIAELQNQLTMANLAASQNAQTAAILTDNLAQTQALEQYLAPVPRPAYIVQNPNCCGTSSMYTACGCSR